MLYPLSYEGGAGRIPGREPRADGRMANRRWGRAPVLGCWAPRAASVALPGRADAARAGRLGKWAVYAASSPGGAATRRCRWSAMEFTAMP